jgi:hypothetical protein
MAWVVPAGWQEFVQLYRMLQQTKVPAQFQPAQRALLTAGATFIDQSNHDVTVFDEDVGKWLNSVQLFGARIRSEAMQQAAAAGQSAPTGVFSDANRFYDSILHTSILENMDRWIYGGQESGQGGEGIHPWQPSIADPFGIGGPPLQQFERLALFAAVALGVVFLGPPLIRALRA